MIGENIGSLVQDILDESFTTASNRPAISPAEADRVAGKVNNRLDQVLNKKGNTAPKTVKIITINDDSLPLGRTQVKLRDDGTTLVVELISNSPNKPKGAISSIQKEVLNNKSQPCTPLAVWTERVANCIVFGDALLDVAGT